LADCDKIWYSVWNISAAKYVKRIPLHPNSMSLLYLLKLTVVFFGKF